MIINVGKKVSFDLEIKGEFDNVIYQFSKPITLELNDLIIESEEKYSIMNLNVNQETKNIAMSNTNLQEIEIKKANYVVSKFFGYDEIEKLKSVLLNNGGGFKSLVINIYADLQSKLLELNKLLNDGDELGKQ